jgi:hypothetical protein
MVSFAKLRLRWVPLILLAAVAGCGDSGPTIVPVTGTVTYKGHPVANAYIFFMPADGNGRPSQGPTDAEGHFKLSYTNEKDGVLVGKHKVWIGRPQPTTRAQQEATMMGKKVPLARDMAGLLEKYGQSNSKVEVVIDKSTRELKLDWD